jgi:hypothetical protein
VSTDVSATAVRPGPGRAPADLGLTAGEPGVRPPLTRSVLGLIRAVLGADAQAFAAAAATLTHTVVAVVGSDGSTMACSAGRDQRRPGCAWEPAGEAREILLRDEAGLHGALRISPDLPGASPAARADLSCLLRDLGLALLRSIQSARRQRALESQLVLLSCLSGRGDAGAPWPEGAATDVARRMVIIRAATAITGYDGARLLNTVLRAAGETAALPGLSLVATQGSLAGLYPETGLPLAGHREAWARLLGAASPGGPLTVAVGVAVPARGDFPAQFRLLGEVATMQQSGSRYFSLPQVVMLDDLGPLAEVIEAAPGRGFAPFVERVLGDLLDDTRFGGQLIETLHAYLQSGGSPREAGALLHLHPSTVKYRIRVIREILGPRLDDRGSRLDIELAVRLCLAAGVSRASRAADPGLSHRSP